MDTTIKAALVLTIVAGSTFAAGSATAQSYPSKPIWFISPFPPGGPVDAVARLLTPILSEAFKQSVVVDNRPGASGMIGIETCVRAAPDGYTLMIVSGSYAASVALYQLPRDITARWNMEIDRNLQLPDLRARLAGDAMEPAGGPTARFLDVLRRDVAKWQKVVKIAGIKPGS